jgi:hypothetical protein
VPRAAPTTTGAPGLPVHAAALRAKPAASSSASLPSGYMDFIDKAWIDGGGSLAAHASIYVNVIFLAGLHGEPGHVG